MGFLLYCMWFAQVVLQSEVRLALLRQGSYSDWIVTGSTSNELLCETTTFLTRPKLTIQAGAVERAYTVFLSGDLVRQGVFFFFAVSNLTARCHKILHTGPLTIKQCHL